ncbi:acyltransferase [Hymenobacter sediminis]|uniref:acyltransferase family protein n=1 Tax=Hymenobacter sediminis TaxID=2218621 RepID=UPI000DA663B2|nr:acyltransferase [Hymenobacter sediminis]RPD45500.1 acyltransferase [Hymenobacter sediminis]
MPLTQTHPSSIAQESGNAYFKPLTGLRSVAAYLVYLYHYNIYQVFTDSLLLRDLVHELHIGVSIFFVLSGFLIAYRYLGKIERSRTFVFTYFRNRIARIYPVYFLLTSLTFLYLLKYPDYDNLVNIPIGEKYLLNITFLRGFFFKVIYSGVGQGWSLTVEECFYALAPLVLFTVGLRASYGRQIGTLVLTWVCVLGLGLLLKEGLPTGPYGFLDSYPLFFSYTIFGRIFEFLVGMLLAFYLRNQNVRAVSSSGARTYGAIVGILACVCGLVAIQRHFGVAPAIDHPYGMMLNNFILPFTVACLLWGLVTESTWLSRLLSSKVADVLGKSSYAFYLLHAGIIYRELVGRLKPDTPVKYMLVFLIINALSIGLYYLVEEPMNKFIRRRFAVSR